MSNLDDIFRKELELRAELSDLLAVEFYNNHFQQDTRDVLVYLVQGKTNAEVSRLTGVKANTVAQLKYRHSQLIETIKSKLKGD